jgi:spore germination protein YaaH
MIGDQHHYSVCRELLRVNATTAPVFDNRTDAVFFNYKKNGHGLVHQVWMDNPQTLLSKYDLATNFGLRGVGIWNADNLNYSANASSEVQQDTRDMWNALHRFPTKTNEADG